jgi:dTDP-4-dehydrorhamnose reductase
VTAPGRSELDLSDPTSIREAIQEIRPQLIVNAAAYTAVDQAEKEGFAAHAVNTEAPAVLAEEAKKIGAALVHYSTDYVFDGSNTTPYTEDDPPNPVSVYGRTKFAGEQAIRDSGVAHLNFRTAWVYGTRGRNFLLTILRLASQREELTIVRDQIGAPTASREIAAATVKILEQLYRGNSSQSILAERSGTYNLTASGETSWFAFANSILEEARQIAPDIPWFAAATGGRPLIARRIIPISTEEYPTPARRPAYSVLSNARLLQTFGFALPDWRTQLHQMFLPQ